MSFESQQGSAEEEPLFIDDGMDALPTDVQYETLDELIGETGLSPEALEQFRIDHSAQ